QGTPYSVLESVYNYDQNNDGIIDATEHNGCIAISGRLVLDQDLNIQGCPNIRMQPCSEVAVNAFGHLTMEYNNIYGCETMWRGITVASSGRLTFRNNIVADAQYALLVTPTGPFTGLTPTQVDIQHNRFERDHIGLYIPGTGGGIFGGNVWQTPFFGNVMECRGKNNALGDLLPPCDAGLPNYDPKNGYAGAAILGANFDIGAASGIRNQFINLRNGVIAENVFLDVLRSDFENMIGFMDTQQPGFAFSTGAGVAATGGIVDVTECTFDWAGHAVNHHEGLVSFKNSQTDQVRIGLEVRRPFAVVMEDNDQIGFLRHGVLGWDLRKSPWLEKYVFDHNVFQTQDNQEQTSAKGHAMLLSNANNGILLSSDFSPQITNNIVNLDDYVRGIFVDGIGGWRIADNSVSINMPQNPPTATYKNYGFLLNRSDINYVYGNTVSSSVAQAALDDGIKGFEITMNTDNVFCCNTIYGSDVGFNFTGTCMDTELRQTDFADHSLSLVLQDNTIIGHQPYQILGTNTTNSNRFHAGSGTAQHWGPDLIVNKSLFFVTNNNTPHYPEFVSTPNAPSIDWFRTNQADIVHCLADPACPQVEYPYSARSAVSSLDLALVSGDFDTLVNAAMLRWELARDLYSRLKAHPEMHGQAAPVDSFYSTAEAGGPIKSFYEAEQLVAAVDEAPEAILSPLQYLRDSIEAIVAESGQVLEGLESAGTRADSLGIYWQAQAPRDRLIAPLSAFAEVQIALDSLRQARAAAALPTIEALPESDLLQSNLKTVWHTYLAWLASGTVELSESQFEAIDEIAHQCPLTDGRAVLVARGLYRSVLIENFDDDVLCLPSGGRPAQQREGFASERAVVIRPNPATNQAHLSFPGKTGEAAQVQVFDLAGRLVLQAVAYSGAHDLDLSAIRPGLYLCRVSVGSNQFPPVKLSIIR
ncbi:MAG: T9SS type A sorting domain-containing protein, partial [Saprospiraceae bacterium]